MPAKFTGYSELESAINSLDSAEIRKVWVGQDKETSVQQKQYSAIWNTSKGKTEAVMSNKYTLVQHKDAFFPLLQAVQTFQSGCFGFITDEGGKAYIDVLFEDEQFTFEPDDAEKIHLGIRASNTYDGTGAFTVRAYGYRKYCDNGMVFGKRALANSYQIHRGTVSVDVFTSILNKIKDFIPSIRACINEAIQDELEFSQIQKILKEVGIGKRQGSLILSAIITQENPTRWSLYNAVTDFITHRLDNRTELTRERYHEKAEAILTIPAQELLRARVIGAFKMSLPR